jgi:glycerol transport system permease protein
MRLRRRIGKICDILAYVVIFFLATAILTPIVWTFLVSLKSKSSMFSRIPLWWNFIYQNNYYRPFMVEGYSRAIVNSALTSIGCIILSIPIAFIAAYAFSRFRIFGSRSIFFWMLTCRMSPEAVFIIPYYLMITRLGLYDHTLSLILVFSLFNVPFAIWMLKSGIDRIPHEIDEAALIDGASISHLLFRIILPLAVPALAAASIMIYIFSWNEYLLASVLTGMNAKTLTVALQAFVACSQIRWGEMAAVTIASFIPTIITVTLLQRYIVSGLTMGAVEGGS